MTGTPENNAPDTAVSEHSSKKTDIRKRKRRRKRIRRLIICLILLCALGLAGYMGYQQLRAEYRVTYDSYVATTGTISNSLSFSGTMQLINSANYTASSASTVREVYVSVGDRVQEGDKLVRLKNGDTYTADFDGTVNKVEVAKGDDVSAGALLVQIADFDHMRVTIRIGESNISDVAIGAPCRVSVSSINCSFDASITTIDYASYTGNNVAYYTTTVEVDTSSVNNIYPGMQATVTIPQEEASNVVILKMDAISTDRNNSAFVYKLSEDGAMEAVPVTVGVSNGNYVEIRDGVESGETVFAVAEEEETATGLAALFQNSFGSQQVNMPANDNRGNGGFGNNGNGGNNTQRAPGNRGN